MTPTLQAELLQRKPFNSLEQEATLNIARTEAALREPLEELLKGAGVSLTQYNVLRILRGSQPSALPSGEIATRMISRDPDITRLVDRLEKRGLVARVRGRKDRRVVEVEITEKGLELLRSLDEHVDRFPRSVLGHLGPKKLEQLGVLIEQTLTDLGTFP